LCDPGEQERVSCGQDAAAEDHLRVLLPAVGGGVAQVEAAQDGEGHGRHLVGKAFHQFPGGPVVLVAGGEHARAQFAQTERGEIATV
jgi:hypothetical protein